MFSMDFIDPFGSGKIHRKLRDGVKITASQYAKLLEKFGNVASEVQVRMKKAYISKIRCIMIATIDRQTCGPCPACCRAYGFG